VERPLIPEVLLASLALAAALRLLVGPKRAARRWGLLAWLVGSLALLAGAERYRAAVAEPPVANRPLVEPQGGYTSSDACRSCHPAEYDAWAHSWHRTMTQVATPERAIGNFESRRLTRATRSG
jgi:hypothetical protein